MSESADTVFTGTGQTPDHLKFDEAALEAYLTDHIDGYKGPMTVEKFKGGQSNPVSYTHLTLPTILLV